MAPFRRAFCVGEQGKMAAMFFLYLELWGYDGSPEMKMMYLLENGGAPARQV